jgi:hypothetical protein
MVHLVDGIDTAVKEILEVHTIVFATPVHWYLDFLVYLKNGKKQWIEVKGLRRNYGA